MEISDYSNFLQTLTLNTIKKSKIINPYADTRKEKNLHLHTPKYASLL